ncbi:MAG: ABC transporter permease [Phycisphaerae bacterium]|nr:ABC transporter permease [Saprospiraceae bacterium]
MDMKTSSSEKDQAWTVVIRPKRPWWDLNLSELWRYRDLIGLWVRREFVAVYKQTILGPLWHVIPTLISSAVFTVVFGNIAQISTEGTPAYLFYMAGNTIWVYFSGCVSSTSVTFAVNVGIFGKVYFPRLAMPIASIISQLITFGVRLGVFLALWLFFLLSGSSVHPTGWVFLLPVLLLIVAGMGFGLGIMISALTTKYRDLQQLLGVGLTLVMYASPIIYPLSEVTGTLRLLLLLNPLSPVLEIFRLGFLGKSAISPIYLLYSVGFTIVVLLMSVIIFHKAESTFLDTI